MPTVQDMPLEIQHMIMNMTNDLEWQKWKLYKGNNFRVKCFPYLDIVSNNLVLKYCEVMWPDYTFKRLRQTYERNTNVDWTNFIVTEAVSPRAYLEND